jgi:hypothetical protein
VELKLFVWGVLNSFFYIFEIKFAQFFLHSKSIKKMPTFVQNFLYTSFCAINILFLIFVNLIGYSVGLQGFHAISHKIFSFEGFKVLFICYYFLLVGVNCMLFIEKNFYKKENQY